MIALKREDEATQVLDWIATQPALKKEVDFQSLPWLWTNDFSQDLLLVISFKREITWLQRGFYFSSLMALLGKSSTLGAQQALRLHDSMQTQGIALDLISYNIVINAAGTIALGFDRWLASSCDHSPCLAQSMTQ